jgi:hypothetical protein
MTVFIVKSSPAKHQSKTATSLMASKESREKARKELETEFMVKFGFVPNGLRELTLSPMAAKIYLTAVEHKKEFATLTFTERHVIDYITSEYHNDEYSIQMHRNCLIGKANMTPSDVETIKRGQRKELEKLGRVGWIAVATYCIVRNYCSNISDEELEVYRNQGIDRELWYEIASYVGMKFVSNIVNNISKPKLDLQFQ